MHDEILPHTNEFAGAQLAPARVGVEAFARDDDRPAGREIVRVRSQARTGSAEHLARRAFQDEKRVFLWISVGPELCRGDEDEVERLDGKFSADPAQGGSDTRVEVSAVSDRLRGDQREESLAVGLPRGGEPRVRGERRQAFVEGGEVADLTVVGEEPAVLGERVGVLRRHGTGAGVTDMSDHRRSAQGVRSTGEGRIVERRQGVLVDDGCSPGLEGADPEAVGIAVALHREAVRRVDEPEGGVGSPVSRMKSEQPAHAESLHPAAVRGRRRAVGGTTVALVWTSIERRPLLVDAIVAVVAFAFFAVLDVTRTGWATIPVDALFAAAIGFRRRSPGIGLAIAWVGALTQLVILPSFINGNVLIAVVIFATSLARQPLVQRLGLVSSVVGGIIASVKLVLITGDFLPQGQPPAQEALSRVIYFVGVAGIVAAALAVFWLLGMIARVRRELLTERLERLEGEQDLLRAELRVAQETERTRISREMHDAIGHSLAVIIAQSDGARYAVAKNPEAAGAALGVINRSARSALDDVSELLSVLAGSTGHQGSLGVADLRSLLTNMESSGLEIEFGETGERLELSRSCDLALFRVVQEALTNALKHGGAGTKAVITLAWSDSDVTVDSLTEETDGPGLLETGEAPRLDPGDQASPARGGYGIAGMVERVRLVGGTVDSGPRADGKRGYFVRATIPHAPGGTE